MSKNGRGVFEYPTENFLWEIVEDPIGMAYETIYEGKYYVSKKEYDNMIQ